MVEQEDSSKSVKVVDWRMMGVVALRGPQKILPLKISFKFLCWRSNILGWHRRRCLWTRRRRREKKRRRRRRRRENNSKKRWRQVKSDRLWCRTTFTKLGNVNKVSCLFTKVKEVRDTDEDTEEIINVINASKWLHFVLKNAPISKFKRNLASGWLELGKNSAKMN